MYNIMHVELFCKFPVCASSFLKKPLRYAYESFVMLPIRMMRSRDCSHDKTGRYRIEIRVEIERLVLKRRIFLVIL